MLHVGKRGKIALPTGAALKAECVIMDKNMNLLKPKYLKFNKLMIFVLCLCLGFIIGFASDKLTNKKISNFITLSYL